MTGQRDVPDRQVFTVSDALGQPRTFAFEFRGDQLICSGPRWWQADADTVDAILAGLAEARDQSRNMGGS